MKNTAPKLTLIGSYGSHGGEDYIILHRDARGNLYETNNAVSQQQLSWTSNLHGSSEEAAATARNIYRELRNKYGMKCILAANYLSQSGYYEHLTEEQQSWVDRWNRKYNRD